FRSRFITSIGSCAARRCPTSILSIRNSECSSRHGSASLCRSRTCSARFSRETSADPMRDLLFLAHRIPYPPNKGDKIRAWNFLRHLAERRRVHLGCFVDDEQDWAHVEKLKEV